MPPIAARLREALRDVFDNGLNDNLLWLQAKAGRNLRGERIAPENLARLRAARPWTRS